MEENINIEQQAQEETITDIKETVNPFILDGPVGRLWFIMTILILFIISFGVFYLIASLYDTYGSIENLPIFLIVGGTFCLLVFYVNILNYVKRLYDLLGERSKAIFYTIAIFLINLAASFIPYVKYLGLAFTVAIFIILIVKQGKLVK